MTVTNLSTSPISGGDGVVLTSGGVKTGISEVIETALRLTFVGVIWLGENK